MQAKKNPYNVDPNVRQAKEAYQTAYMIAQDNLDPAAPLRLQVACDMASFYQDILHNIDKAHDIAKKVTTINIS